SGRCVGVRAGVREAAFARVEAFATIALRRVSAGSTRFAEATEHDFIADAAARQPEACAGQERPSRAASALWTCGSAQLRSAHRAQSLALFACDLRLAKWG